MKYEDDILNYLLLIPKGRVSTYGNIARYLGDIHLSRYVGNVLHNNPNPNKYPCYKIVNNKGNLSKNFGFGGIEEQKKRLENDGIIVIDYKVDIKKYMYGENICKKN